MTFAQCGEYHTAAIVEARLRARVKVRLGVSSHACGMARVKVRLGVSSHACSMARVKVRLGVSSHACGMADYISLGACISLLPCLVCRHRARRYRHETLSNLSLTPVP